jgi:pimeloyl-ACP methyl ester carboxylesterase
VAGPRGRRRERGRAVVTVTEQAVAIRDGAVRFRVVSAGQGPALLYFHSLHDREEWPLVLDRLAERHTVHAPLHPGARGSEGVEALDDVVDLALAYDELLGALGLSSACLLGHGFGGMVAAELGALCPRRARRLCLIAPLGLWLDALPIADAVILPEVELVRVLWKDPDAEAARRWRHLPDAEPERVAAQIDQIQRLASMGKFVWPVPDKGLGKRLHRVAAPTLLLWGDADRVVPVPYGREFARRIRTAALEVLPGGHMLHLESPGEVARAAADFFA